ncbi:MAG TPA: zf-HC2 domain-containing protein [Terriglobia bacterium]|nr:zf-HC2 domain-containing protein [Terriglobia bacterium]
MNVVNFNDRSCERYRRYFDAYLDNELLIETNQDVLHHLNSCPECSRILEARAEMKRLVKDAVGREEAPPELVAAVRTRLQKENRSFFSGDTARWMMAAAAVALFAIMGWSTAIRWGVWPFGNVAIQTVSDRVQELLRVGLIDHVHCSIIYKQWQKLLSFDQMKAETGPSALGPEFIDLVPIVESRVGKEFSISQGHRCRANHREYIHVILKGQSDTLLSLVVTRKEREGESFSREEAVAVLNAADVPVYATHEGQLEIAGFETEHFLAYVVSNLERADNLRVAETLAPAVREHLARLEL